MRLLGTVTSGIMVLPVFLTIVAMIEPDNRWVVSTLFVSYVACWLVVPAICGIICTALVIVEQVSRGGN